MPNTSIEVRRPEFLERALGRSGVGVAPFLGGAGASKVRVLPTEPPPAPAPRAPTPPPVALPAPVVALAEVEARLKEEFTARIGAAIDLLKVHGERLAAEARVDAVEIAFVVARKIIDTELSLSVEPLVGMIRTAVRRLGESRRIVVRLSSRDAEAIATASASRGSSVLAGISAAQVEVIADADLEPGDCVVDGEFGSVDGRLGNRIEELRRAVLAQIGQEP